MYSSQKFHFQNLFDSPDNFLHVIKLSMQKNNRKAVRFFSHKLERIIQFNSHSQAERAKFDLS